MRARSSGFTLMEMVVAIAVSSVVMLFAVMLMAAPVDAFEADSRRSAVVDEAAAAWPAIETDLKRALPNSLRARRNGTFVTLELLRVQDYARYKGTPPAAPFEVIGVPLGMNLRYFLSINNCGPPACADAYSSTGSMTGLVTIDVTNGAAGEQHVTVMPAPVFASDSPRKTLYLVSGPVTWLCDEATGTLRRYDNYLPAANPASRDDPGDFAIPGVNVSLMATGLSSCDFRASPPSATVPQTASLRLTATRATGETITLFHAAGSGWLP